MFLYSIIISIIGLFLILNENLDSFKIIIYFSAASVLGNTMAYRLTGYVKEMHMLFHRLKEEATVDFLTGLNNVRKLDLVLNEYRENIRENTDKISLMVLDIDFFKKVNDTYGHAAGDKVLREIGKILSANCRTSDTIFRIGGEEFAVLMRNTSLESGINAAERIRKIVEKHTFSISESTKINITISIGVSNYSDKINGLEELMKKADDFLYKAKQSGRNKVCFS